MKDFILQHINTTRKASFRNCFATLHFAKTTSQQTTDYRLRTTDNGLQRTRQRDN